MVAFKDKLKEFLSQFNIDLFSENEISVQDKLAPKLRAAVVQYLETGEGTIAAGFRGVFAQGIELDSTGFGGDYKKYTQLQAKDGTYGTGTEAQALGELFGVHVVVNQIEKGKSDQRYCIYRAEDDKAPTIILNFEKNNAHYSRNKKTKGNGNCLYNAFAQAFFDYFMAQEKPVVEASANHTCKFFKSNSGHLTKKLLTTAEKEALELQRAIEKAIKKAPTVEEVKQQFANEAQRLASLSNTREAIDYNDPIQKQIDEDYQLALSLAQEELEASRSYFSKK